MSDTTTTAPDVPVEAPSGHGFVKISGLIVAIIGAIMLIGGAGTSVFVQTSLADERVTVSDDASSNAGKAVNGPFTALLRGHGLSRSTHSRPPAARRTPNSTARTRFAPPS